VTVGVRGTGVEAGRSGLSAAAETWGPRAGLVGAVVFGAATLASALAYGGPSGVYSPLNRWVSELGEVGVSSMGAVFNAGLIVGGAAFALFMGAFGLTRDGRLAAAAGVVGLASGLFGTLVGVFPLGGGGPHRTVAIGFFVLGAIALALATADIARRPTAAFPRWLARLGGLVVAAFVGFILLTLTRGYIDVVEPRPALLAEPLVEWLAVGGILLWTGVASLTWLRARP
jgi:hypothetical membrane protein